MRENSVRTGCEDGGKPASLSAERPMPDREDALIQGHEGRLCRYAHQILPPVGGRFDAPVAVGLLAGVLAGDQDEALELGDEDAVLVEDAGVDLDHAAVGL
jgi:hypothetical protein